jgi:uncharacterized repeat protein (TIGR03803 family)
MSKTEYLTKSGPLVIASGCASDRAEKSTSRLGRAAALQLAVAAALATGGASCALAKDHAIKVLYSFADGTDGAYPNSTMITDKAGNLYGTTYDGCGSGTVFKLAPGGTETVLHCFAGAPDGANPRGGLMADVQGNLYGTTQNGGADSAGIVYKLAQSGAESVLYTFTGGADGGTPVASLVKYKADLFGTTFGGGATGWGTVFKLAQDGTETVLHSFTGGADGGQPYAGLIVDKAGNFYGTTYDGGDASCNCGNVFKITPHGGQTVLHNFVGRNDGATPAYGPMIMDSAGNLYGLTQDGGTGGAGTVFKITPGGTETILYNFTGQNGKAGGPEANLIQDSAGDLFSTSSDSGANGVGVVFEITSGGKQKVLYSFTGGSDGCYPVAGLIKDQAYGKGDLYGTAEACGGNGYGTIFAIPQ